MVYLVAQLTKHDRECYQRNMAGFMAVLEQQGGRLLASAEAPEVVEGRWERDKVVLLSFFDRSASEAWASPEAYPRIAQDRITATESPVLLMRGIG